MGTDAGTILGEAELASASLAWEDGPGCTYLSWLTELLDSVGRFETAESLGLCMTSHVVICQGASWEGDSIFHTVSGFAAQEFAPQKMV